MEHLGTASTSHARVPTANYLRILFRCTTPSMLLPSSMPGRLPATLSASCRCNALSNDAVSAIEAKKMDDGNSSVFELSSLTALSPLDGRYWGKVKDLAPSMSEYSLIRYRVLVEIKWLIMLSQIPEVTEVPHFSPDVMSILQGN